MANSPDNKDNKNKISNDRNLARPADVRPTDGQSASNRSNPKLGKSDVDKNRPPRTENLARGKNAGVHPVTEDSTPVMQQQPPPLPQEKSTPPGIPTKTEEQPEEQRLTAEGSAKAAEPDDKLNAAISPPPIPAARSSLRNIDGKMPEQTVTPPANKTSDEAQRARPEHPPLQRESGPRERSRLLRPTGSEASETPKSELSQATHDLSQRQEQLPTGQAEHPIPEGDTAADIDDRRSRQHQARQLPPSEEIIPTNKDSEPRFKQTAMQHRDGRRLPRRAGPPPGHRDRRHASAGAIIGSDAKSAESDQSLRISDARGRTPRATVESTQFRPAQTRIMRPPAGAKPIGRYINRPLPAQPQPRYAAPSSTSSWGPLFLGLLLLAAVGWLAVEHYTPTIQQDLLQRSRASLDNAGFANQTKISIDGRNITLTGNVASAEDSNRAVEVVADTFGVRSVNNELTIGVPVTNNVGEKREAPTFSIVAGDGGITLSGTVSDQKFANTLSQAATTQFDGMEVNNDITIDPATTNPGWAAGITQLLPSLKNIENGAIAVVDDKVVLTGKTDDTDSRRALGEKAEAILGAQLIIDNQIEAPEPASPSLPAFASVSETENTVILNGFMSADGADAIAAAFESSGKTIVNNISSNELAETPAWVDKFNTALTSLDNVTGGKLTIARSGNIKLQGVVETEAQKQSIEDKVVTLFGTETTISNLIEVVPVTVAPTIMPQASVSQTANSITVSGVLPEQAAKDILSRISGGDKEVINRISIDERVMYPEWANALSQSIDRLGSIENGNVDLSEGVLTLKGKAKTEQAKQFTAINIGTLFGSNVTLNNEINVLPERPKPELTSETEATTETPAEAVAASDTNANTGKQSPSVSDNSVDNDTEAPAVSDNSTDNNKKAPAVADTSTNTDAEAPAVSDNNADNDTEATAVSDNNADNEAPTESVSETTSNSESEPAAASSPSLTPFVSVSATEQQITLAGLLPEDSAATIVSAYSGRGKIVTNNITIDERVMQPDWTDAVSQSLERLESLENPGINISSDGTATLRGEASTEQSKQFAAINLGTLFGNSVSLRNDITVKSSTINEPPKPDVAALLENLDLSAVRFRSGSADLDDNSQDILNDVIEILNLDRNTRILIAGHTDSRGNIDYNFSLSADRANAVQQLLVNGGISADRLTARGFGPTQPIASNDTAGGRALNRRIEIQLIGE